MTKIGNKITELRKQKGWSQGELAIQIDVSREAIGKYERNKAVPSVGTAKNIADVFDVSLDYLVGDVLKPSFDKRMLERLQVLNSSPKMIRNICSLCSMPSFAMQRPKRRTHKKPSPMKNEFTEVMSKNSDDQLIQIVTTKKEDYRPEAVLAAEEEIKKRKLSPELIEVAKENLRKKEAMKSEKEDEPLGLPQKILFFIFFWGIFPWMIAATYKADGYLRKYRDAWKSIKYGLITWLIVTGLVFLIIYVVFK